MARSLSVKVPTASLIALVENKIADLEAKIASYPADVKAYKEAKKVYTAALLKATIEALNANPDAEGIDAGLCYNGRDVNVSIDSTLVALPEAPVAPTDPNVREWFGNTHAARLDVLKKNLQVLKMTTQEEVNASTYNSVMELL